MRNELKYFNIPMAAKYCLLNSIINTFIVLRHTYCHQSEMLLISITLPKLNIFFIHYELSIY